MEVITMNKKLLMTLACAILMGSVFLPVTAGKQEAMSYFCCQMSKPVNAVDAWPVIVANLRGMLQGCPEWNAFCRDIEETKNSNALIIGNVLRKYEHLLPAEVKQCAKNKSFAELTAILGKKK